MRRRVWIGVAAAAALLGGCGAGPVAPTEDPTVAATTAPADPAPSASPTPEPFDPASVDLANATWLVSTAGYVDPPVEVTLSDGAAAATLNAWDGRFEHAGDAQYLDLDGDGDDDVIAAVSFSAEVAPGTYQWVLTDWFAWLNTGDALEQLIYPLEGAGDCADGEASFAPSDGGGVRIEQLRMAETGTCAEGATVPVTRTVVVRADAEGTPWPVQTEPVAAWGGDCPLLLGPSDGEVALVVAPGLEDLVAPGETPVAVGLGESWLDAAVPGWQPVGFATTDQRIEEYGCGWAPTS